jgi:hypothetical protein
VIKRHTGDADAVIAHVGEIRQPQPTWRVLLPEDDVPLGPVERPPGADAPFQGPADTDADLPIWPREWIMAQQWDIQITLAERRLTTPNGCLPRCEQTAQVGA